MSETIIQANHINYAYEKKLVLEEVSFSVTSGQFVGLIGPNGSGKTTLLKIILGLLEPDSGEILVFGEKVKVGKQGSKVSYIPQKVTQAESRFPITVEEVVSLGRVVGRGLGRVLNKEDKKRVKMALEAVGLWTERWRLVADLSGGQQQRVFIAKALAGEPHLLIFDEPTVGVDWEAQESFYELLKKLNEEQGLTILLVSHDIEIVAKAVNSVLCLNKKLVYHGNPQILTNEKSLTDLYGQHHQFVDHNHHEH